MPAPVPAARSFAADLASTARLAAPLVAGQLASVAITVIDTLLAGHHGAATLAAVAVGTAVWSLVILVLIGILLALPPCVAQLDGAGRRAEIGPLFRQALWLALALGLGLLLFVYYSEWLLVLAGVTPQVRPDALGFLRAVAWGAPALALYFCLRYVSEGIACTVPTMVFGIAGLLVLAPLGWALMFGRLGLPEWGARGLGVATALTVWLQVLSFAAYLRWAPRYADLGLFARFDWPQRRPLAELLRVGLPMGWAILMEGGLFVATALLIGRMGAIQVAAHQIAINVASVSFMVPLGIAMATTVRVGHAAGAGDRPAVRAAAAAGLLIVLAAQLLAALVMAFGNDWLVALYTPDLRVGALAAQLLLFAAAFQFPDGIQALAGGALRGLKDTRVPALITVLAYWGCGMSVGVGLAFGVGVGVQGMWIGLTAGLSVAAVLLSWRFVRLARD